MRFSERERDYEYEWGSCRERRKGPSAETNGEVGRPQRNGWKIIKKLLKYLSLFLGLSPASPKFFEVYELSFVYWKGSLLCIGAQTQISHTISYVSSVLKPEEKLFFKEFHESRLLSRMTYRASKHNGFPKQDPFSVCSILHPHQC